MRDTVALQMLYLFFIRGEIMKKTVYCAALCIMQHAAYGIFNHVPGDQIWVMVNELGRTNQAIKGFATPITNADLPLNITVSGRYAAVEPLSYTPGGSPITIDADNVYLTFNGYTLTVGNKTASSIVVMNGRNNVSIVNGAINGGDTVFFMGNHDGITLDSLYMNDCGTAGNAAFTIAGGSNNITASNLRENGRQNSDGLFIQNCTNIRVSNCSFDNNLSNGLVITECRHATVENVIANQTNLTGITIGTSSDVYLTNCSVAALSAGLAPIAYNILEDSEQVVLNNCSSAGNGTNSIGLFIRDCTAVSCKKFSSYNDNIGIQQSDTVSNSSLITIEDSTIELAATNAILFDTNISNVLFQNVNVISAGATAILGTNGSNIVFKNLQLLDLVGDAGIQFTTLDNFVLKNSSLIGHTPLPTTLVEIIDIANISNSLVKNNTLLGNHNLNNGINLSATVLNTCLLDNYVSNVSSFGIQTFVASNYVLANNIAANNDVGIGIANGTACAIRNCTCDNNLIEGIGFGGTKSAITHNNVNFNNQTLPANTGISISNASLNYIGFNNIVLKGSGGGSTAIGITEGAPGGNAFLGNMIQNFSNGTGGGASTISSYTSSPFNCTPAGGADPVPASHWENLHIIYS